jgi:hypothetical protein
MHTFEITYMERKSMTFRRKNVKMVVAKSIYLLPMIAKIATITLITNTPKSLKKRIG